MERLLKENMGYSENIKGIINKLTTDVELSKKNDPNEPETTAKITNLRSLQTGLMELMSRNQQAQTDYKSNMKDRIGRQIGLLDENLSKEETNKLCNDPDVRFFYLITL